MKSSIKNQLKKRSLEDIKTISSMNVIDKLKAKDAIIAPVFLKEEDGALNILQKLKKEDIQTCIVVNENINFIWEISVEDIIKLFIENIKKEPLTKYLNRWYKKNIIHKTAWELCNRHNNSLKEDSNINQVIKLIYKKWFNYIPIVDEQKKVIWVVTPSSLINLLKDY